MFFSFQGNRSCCVDDCPSCKSNLHTYHLGGDGSRELTLVAKKKKKMKQFPTRVRVEFSTSFCWVFQFKIHMTSDEGPSFTKWKGAPKEREEFHSRKNDSRRIRVREARWKKWKLVTYDDDVCALALTLHSHKFSAISFSLIQHTEFLRGL